MVIAAILVTAITLALVSVILLRSERDLNQVGHDRRHHRAIQAADAGIDHTMMRILQNTSHSTGDPAAPSFGSRTQERNWVIAQAADNPVTKITEGEWTSVKPTGQVVYGVGYIPTRASARVIRVVRAQYDLPGFAADMAILTDGELAINGNPDILGTHGSAHANGPVTVSGNPEFSGFLASAGTYSVTGSVSVGDAANTGGGKPRRNVPLIRPRDYYSLSQYDLCPNGQVRRGPAYPGGGNTSSTPCNGAILATATSTEYRGWKRTGLETEPGKQGAKWDYSSSTRYDGVYYIYQGSAKISGNPGNASTGDPAWNATIIAEATSTGAEPHSPCIHTGGDIEFSGNPTIRRNDAAQPVALIAGRDLVIQGNPNSGDFSYEGLSGAHEQFRINGNPVVFGAFIINDYCDTSSPNQSLISRPDQEIPGNPRITYNGGLSLPVSTGIRVTNWLEL